MALAPAVFDEHISRGDTYKLEFVNEEGGVPVSMAGRVCRLTVRTDTGTLLGEATSAAGSIVYDSGGVPGKVVARIEAAVTRTWPVGTIRRDFEEVNGADVQTLLVGSIRVDEDQST